MSEMIRLNKKVCELLKNIYELIEKKKENKK